MPPVKSAEKNRRFRTFLVVLLAVTLCALPLSCARHVSDITANAPGNTSLSALLATASPPYMAEAAIEMPAAPPTATPALAAAAELSSSPTAAPTPTVKPTAQQTIKPTPKPTPKATIKPAAKYTPRKTSVPTAKPKVTVTPTATPASPSGGVKSQEDKMISLVNAEREKAGLKALSYSSGLRTGALKHSNDMSANNFFSHTSPTYGSFQTRFNKAGYSSGAENIAMYGSIAAAHTALMKSEGHRKNIMNSAYTRIGIGIVYNKSKGVYYITQWFAK